MNRIFFIGLIALTFAACSESNTSTTETTNEQEQLQDSLAWINQQILKDPNNSDLYFQKAKYYWDKDLLNNTIQEIDRAISIDSNNLDYLNFKGDALYQVKDLIAAKEIFEKVLEKDELNIFANTKMAWISLIAGQHDACFVYANNALKNDQYFAEAYYIKGLAYKELGNFKLSVSNFRTATEQDNDYIDAWLQLGYLHDAAEDTLAGAFYENALRVDSNNINALYAFGIHLQSWGLGEEAIEQYQHILRVNKDFHNAYYNIGYVYLEIIGQNDSALKYFTTVIDLNPYNHKAYYNRGLAKERSDNNRGALMDYEKALELKPDFDLPAKGKSRILE